MTDVRLRLAEPRDAEQVASLVSGLGYDTSPEEMACRLHDIFADRNYVTVVAAREEHVVGVAGGTLGRYYEKDGLYARLVLLAVSPDARSLGVGTRLVSEISDWSRRHGARELLVNSGTHREGAHAFYERCGFRRTGFRFVKSLVDAE
jgi:GNAT superfamily N-acetyltransferase